MPHLAQHKGSWKLVQKYKSWKDNREGKSRISSENICGFVVVSILPLFLCSRGPRSWFWTQNNSVQPVATSQKFWLFSVFKVFIFFFLVRGLYSLANPFLVKTNLIFCSRSSTHKSSRSFSNCLHLFSSAPSSFPLWASKAFLELLLES